MDYSKSINMAIRCQKKIGKSNKIWPDELYNNFSINSYYISNTYIIEYVLEDNNSSIELDYDKKIGVGDKIIKFKVISQSGKSQIYTLNLYRYSKYEEQFYLVVGLLVLGLIGFGIYKLIKFVLKYLKK